MGSVLGNNPSFKFGSILGVPVWLWSEANPPPAIRWPPLLRSTSAITASLTNPVSRIFAFDLFRGCLALLL